ncbi:translation initiation factor IF-2-like [Haliotis rubra]|uniref:translation initiation factor IF-2-like n=1 Tax=Haliotis rubra TaxID=36100 RepID=UPI001EE501DD|nr:translation initiation factor IF-2-like [Haliotis rubra]
MQILGVLVLIALAGTGLDAVKIPGPAASAKAPTAAVAPTAAPATGAQSLPIYRPSQPATKPAVNSAAGSGGYNPYLSHPSSPFRGINPLFLDPDLIYPDPLIDYPLDPLGHGLGHLNPLGPGAHLSPLASLGIGESVYGDLHPSSEYLLQEALLRRAYGAPKPTPGAAPGAGAPGAGAPGAGASGAINNGGYNPYDTFLDQYLINY